MYSSVPSNFILHPGDADIGGKFCKFSSIPCQLNTNPPFLSSRTKMGFSDYLLTVTRSVKIPRRKIRMIMNRKGKVSVFSSNGFDLNPELIREEENAVGLEFADESVDNMSVYSSSKGVKDGNDEFAALVNEKRLKEEAKSRVSKQEGRVHSSLDREEGGYEKFGGLDFDEPPLVREAKGRVSSGESLMDVGGVGRSDDELELQDEDEELEEDVRAMPKTKGKVGSISRRKQMIKRSSLLAKQVIGVQSALSLGFVSQLWVDTTSWAVLEVEVKPSLLSSESGIVLFEDIKQVGDVVLVQEENFVLSECNTIGLETLVGYSVVTPGQGNLGKVRGYTINISSGFVESLELDAFGYSIIPLSLVSTYALYTEDVLQVLSDTIIVHEAAVSHIQRLTKGLFGTKNTDRSNYNLEYDDMETDSRRPLKRGKSRRKRSRQKPSTGKSGLDDDLELPMDFM